MGKDDVRKLVSEGICPVCKNKLAHKEGCIECEFCGWSLCDEA